MLPDGVLFCRGAKSKEKKFIPILKQTQDGDFFDFSACIFR